VTRDPIDWAHTDKARHDREIKAQALAAAARELGLRSTDLELGRSGRGPVRQRCGFASVSEETWFEVVAILAETEPPPVVRPPRECWTPSCSTADETVHLYVSGPYCDVHAPWARNGGRRPVPPPGTTLDDLRAAVRDSATAVLLPERILAAKKRAHTAAERARIAEHAHRLFLAGRLGGPDPPGDRPPPTATN